MRAESHLLLSSPLIFIKDTEADINHSDASAVPRKPAKVIVMFNGAPEMSDNAGDALEFMFQPHATGTVVMRFEVYFISECRRVPAKWFLPGEKGREAVMYSLKNRILHHAPLERKTAAKPVLRFLKSTFRKDNPSAFADITSIHFY
jgi:hypothetical protein